MQTTPHFLSRHFLTISAVILLQSSRHPSCLENNFASNSGSQMISITSSNSLNPPWETRMLNDTANDLFNTPALFLSISSPSSVWHDETNTTFTTFYNLFTSWIFPFWTIHDISGCFSWCSLTDTVCSKNYIYNFVCYFLVIKITKVK